MRWPALAVAVLGMATLPGRADTGAAQSRGRSAGAIENGSQFRTVRGDPVQAHGAGVVKVGRYYYLLGENRDGFRFKAVSMYRSTNLRDWEFRNDILKAASAPSLNVSNIERPKVIYNAATRKYVLWAHKENGRDYGEARVVVATSDTVDGDYAYHAEFRPLGHESRDMTLYLDDDGAGYLISSASNNYDLNIYRLNADFTGVEALVTVLRGFHREAPAVFRRNGVYFLITSAATGWRPNRATYQTAPSMAGPWTEPVPFGDARTYNSQSTYVLPLQGAGGASWLYMGDRWAPAIGEPVNASTYVWLPLAFPSATSVELPTASRIALDAARGTIEPLPATATLRTDGALCATVAKASLDYEAPASTMACETLRHQQIERRIAGRDVQFVFQHSGLCLAKAKKGDGIVQTDCNTDRARWTSTADRLANRATGQCLTVAADKLAAAPCGAGTTRWRVKS